MIRYPVILVCVTALTACNDASKAIAGGDSPICKLYQANELSRYVGSVLAAGRNADEGLGCQWLAEDKHGDVMIAVVSSTLHEVPTQVEGYAALPDIGAQAFTAPFLDGWLAAAIVGDESFRVSVAGKAASAASAGELLKETIKRRGTPAP